MNRYSYVSNSPINRIDPSGHSDSDYRDRMNRLRKAYGDKLWFQYRRAYHRRGYSALPVFGDDEVIDTTGFMPSQDYNDPIPFIHSNFTDRTSGTSIVPDGNSLPSSLVMHPLDGNVVDITPVYEYRNGLLVTIGYRETFYAYDYSSSKFDLGASGTIPWLIPVVYEAINWVAKKAVCPACSAALWTWTVINGINDSTTIEGHLQERFIYASRHDFYSYDYNPFFPTYEPMPWNK